MKKLFTVACMLVSSVAQAEETTLIYDRAAYTSEQMANMIVCVAEEKNTDKIVERCSKKIGYTVVVKGTRVDIFTTKQDGLNIIVVLSGPYKGRKYFVMN